MMSFANTRNTTAVYIQPIAVIVLHVPPPVRGAGAAAGGSGAGAPGARPGRAEEAVPGPDGNTGEAEGRQGADPRGRRHLYSRGRNKTLKTLPKALHIMTSSLIQAPIITVVLWFLA